jgi:hypothetical protein
LEFFASETEDEFALYDLEAELTSARQSVAGFDLNNLDLRFYSLDENLFIEGGVAHADSKDSVDLKSYVRLFSGRTEINFPRTEFSVLGTTWENKGSSRNRVIIEGDDIRFREIHFASGEQEVKLEGVLSETQIDTVDLVLNNIDLELLNPYINTQLHGSIYLEAKVASSSEETRVEGYLLTDTVYIQDVLIGVVEGESHYINSEQKVAIELDVQRKGVKTLIVKGDYKETREDKLDLNVIFDGLDLAILQPFADEIISDLRGTTIGVIEVTGDPTSPSVVGDALIVDGQFRVNLLGALYTFSDKILFEGKRLEFKNIRLEDRAHHFAFVSGLVDFQYLDRIRMEIEGDFTNFMVMNLESSPDALFYGKAFASGDLLIRGLISDLFIRVNAATETGTKFYLPIQTATSTASKDYIKFIDFSTEDAELAIIEEQMRNAAASNVRVELNLSLEDEPYAEIILDEATGDIIKGNGEGNMQVIFDTRGDFLMFGEVDITKGSYNFNLAGVVEKKFLVLNGSSIIFNGDPLKGTLNIKAAYDVITSLLPVLANASQGTGSGTQASPGFSRKFPVRVVLNLTGPLLQPDLDFNIEFVDYPATIDGVDVRDRIESYALRLRSDEQLLNQQVFSLIVFRQLAPEGATSFSQQNTDTQGSIGELLSNQLSSLVSSVDENLQIDVDYASSADASVAALQNFNLRISYQFMEGRLRITRSGSLGGDENADANAVIGDWSIEYMISPDGSWRARMYQRQDLNSLGGNTEQNFTRGASIMHTESFNSFRDIFGFLKTKKTSQEIPVPRGESIIKEEKIMGEVETVEDSAGL